MNTIEKFLKEKVTKKNVKYVLENTAETGIIYIKVATIYCAAIGALVIGTMVIYRIQEANDPEGTHKEWAEELRKIADNMEK